MAEPGDPIQPDPDPVPESGPAPQDPAGMPETDVPDTAEDTPETGEVADAGSDAQEADAHEADAHVGFVSAASLTGQARVADSGPEPDVIAPPVESGSTFELSPLPPPSRRRDTGPVEGAMSLYAVYALILFSVPTFGVAAVIGLLAVTGRPGPDGPLARSHFIYQQRTLWTAAVAALLGGILLVIGVGVLVLFLAAVWILIRGAAGVWRLKSGEPVDNPHTLLI